MFLSSLSNFKLLQNVTPNSFADTTRSIPEIKHHSKDERMDKFYLQQQHFENRRPTTDPRHLDNAEMLYDLWRNNSK